MGFRWAGYHPGSADPLALDRHTNHVSARTRATDMVQGSAARTGGPGFSLLGRTWETGSCAKMACMRLREHVILADEKGVDD